MDIVSFLAGAIAAGTAIGVWARVAYVPAPAPAPVPDEDDDDQDGWFV